MTKQDLLLETIAVYDTLGAKYADQIVHVNLPQIREFADMLPAGVRILDIGCAAGRDSASLRDVGFSVVGVDLSRSLLKLARERVTGVDFWRMDARKLNFENEFDGVWAHAVLLNLDRSEVKNVVQGIWNSLKTGGVCLAGVKEGRGEKFIGEALVDNMKRRETYFEKVELENLFCAIGFKIEKSYVCGDALGRSTTKWVYVFARK